MTVTRDDATAALRDIESSRRRSRQLFDYRLASPYLLLWGGLWIVAGAVEALAPESAGIGWVAVDAVGIAGTAGLAVRQARRCGEAGARALPLRWLGTVAVLAAFVGLTLMAFAPVSGLEALTFVTLAVAAAYAAAGCWVGVRYAAVGIALAGVAVAGFHFAPAHLPLIVPFLGGGALVLGGFWMRRA